MLILAFDHYHYHAHAHAQMEVSARSYKCILGEGYEALEFVAQGEYHGRRASKAFIIGKILLQTSHIILKYRQ